MHRAWHLLQQCVNWLIEPPARLQSTELHQRARVMNALLLLFVPLAIGVFFGQQILIPEPYVNNEVTLKAILMGLLVLLTLYITMKLGHYRLAIYIIIGLGFLTIVANALLANPPHVEIIYLVMVPLFATIILSVKGTLIVSGLSLLIITVFNTLLGDAIPPDIDNDLLTFMVLVQGFIVFAAFQRNRLEQRLQLKRLEDERNRVTRDMLQSFSHDFKTPLSIMRTSLYIFERSPDPDKKQAAIERINRQINRLQEDVEAVLTLSGLDIIQISSLRLEALDVNALLTDIMQQRDELAKTKQVTLIYHLSPSLPAIDGNRETLIRAFSSLLQNALRYTPAGGTVSITTTHFKKQVRLEISDTGIGIEDTDLSHIFQPFYRTDASRSSDTGGIGLGLSISKRIIELHGGTIQVESKPQQGTCFIIDLPINQHQPIASILY